MPPQSHVLDLEMMDIEKKIRVGADFFFTHSVYECQSLWELYKKVAPFKVPVIASITLLKSVGMARYINKHVEGLPSQIHSLTNWWSFR